MHSVTTSWRRCAHSCPLCHVVRCPILFSCSKPCPRAALSAPHMQRPREGSCPGLPGPWSGLWVGWLCFPTEHKAMEDGRSPGNPASGSTDAQGRRPCVSEGGIAQSYRHCFENHRNNKTRILILALKSQPIKHYILVFFLTKADLSASPWGSPLCLPCPWPGLRLCGCYLCVREAHPASVLNGTYRKLAKSPLFDMFPCTEGVLWSHLKQLKVSLFKKGGTEGVLLILFFSWSH